MQAAAEKPRFIRLPEVLSRLGVSRTHLYRLMHSGKFPMCVALGARAIGWEAGAVDRWIEERLRETSMPMLNSPAAAPSMSGASRGREYPAVSG